MKRTLFTLTAMAALLAAAAPAFAHEEIIPTSFSTGKPTFFVLSAANEEKVDLVKMTIAAPTGFTFGATTKQPSGWTATKTDTEITWSASTGAGVKPDTFDQWGYETDGVDQPGTFTFKITLAFSDGKTDDVQVPITAVAGSATPTTAPAPGANAPATTIKAVASGSRSNSRANVALGIGIAALVVGLASAALGLRRRGGAPAASAPAGGAEQDW